jgi:hypothetical protein
MPLTTLPNLYTRPQDVFDWLGVEGVQLRLDDQRQATGQQIQAVADAAAGATAVQITALVLPLLKGTVLEFAGGGQQQVSEAVLSATAPKGATSLTVQPLAFGVNNLSLAFDSGVNFALAQRLVKACQYGTGQVKLYCCSRYNDSDLASSPVGGSPNRWATIAACKWLCKRQGQACPQGIEDDWEEALTELRQVRVGMLQIEDIGTRSANWPFISNMTLDIQYDYNKLRVEPQLSELTPVNYPQYIDWNSALFLEF